MIVNRNTLLAAALLVFVCVPFATTAQQPQMPVIAGQGPDYDACGSVGVVRGLSRA